MIGPLWFATSPLVHAIGLGLLHGLWQGIVVAGLAAIALRAVHPMAAGRRHAILLGALVLQLALLALTVAAVYRTALPQSLLIADPAAWPAAVEPSDVAEGHLVGALGDALAAVRPLLPLLLALWAAGVALFAARLVAGVVAAARMRESAVPADPDLERRARELARRLALRRPFRILTADGIDTPVAIGWRRPAVLLPRLLPGRETAAGLDALVLHELAHLKNRDDGVALVQSALKCLFFHHPGTWWLAARLTREREHRCDDLVAAESGDPAAYVRALMGLEAGRLRLAGSALHADAGSLLERVRRIVEPRGGVPRRRLGIGLLAAAAIAVPAAWAQLSVVPAVPATPPGWSTIRAVDDAGPFTVVMEGGRVRAVAIDGIALSAARFAHVDDSLHVLGALGVPVFSARVRPQGGLEWLSRDPGWRLDDLRPPAPD